MHQSYWKLLFSLFIVKAASDCCNELQNSCKINSTYEVFTALGGTAKLPCSLPGTEIQLDRMKWDKSTSGKSYMVHAWPKVLPSPESKQLFGTRLTFQGGEEGVKVGKLSLFLRDARSNDSGTYICWAWKGWECVIHTIVILKVKECEVLKPIIASPKTTVSLPCPFTSYQGNTSTTKVQWFFGPEGQRSSILQHPPTSSLNSTTPIRLQRRFQFSGDLNTGDASLTISELNFNDTNWYMCTVRMGEEREKCQEMKLLVKYLPVSEVTWTPAPGNVTLRAYANEETSGSTVAVVVSAILVCVAVAVVGSAAYSRYHKNTSTDTLVDEPYENISVRGSAFLPPTLYTLAERGTQEDTSMDESH